MCVIDVVLINDFVVNWLLVFGICDVFIVLYGLCMSGVKGDVF